jgi:TetR/AcrR family transcriptional regulator, regulator of autoinduction and epiphytic fitness
MSGPAAASDAAAGPTPRPGRVDGRTARSGRTRAAIVDALLELTAEGVLKPRAESIVQRAGVSLRALWTHFKDMEALYAAAGDRLAEMLQEQHRPVPLDATLDARVDLFCAQRARMLEIIAPAARASQLRLPFSAHLRSYRAALHERHRTEIAAVFGAELRAAGAGRDDLLAGLVAASTWPVWSMLRDDLALDVTTARRVMTRIVGTLLRDRA